MRWIIYKKPAKVQIDWDRYHLKKNRRVYPAVSIWPCCQEKVVGAERFTSYISKG